MFEYEGPARVAASPERIAAYEDARTSCTPTEDVRRLVSRHLDAAIGHLPVLTGSLSLDDLSSLEPGHYVATERLSSKLLSYLPSCRPDGEVGIVRIGGKRILTVSDVEQVSLPEELASLQGRRLFGLDFHSHPGNDAGSRQPSVFDLSAVECTVDGYAYIACEAGLVEFHRPGPLPGGYSSTLDSGRAWAHWIREDLKLNEASYNRIGGWELKSRFYEEFFGMHTIPWSDSRKIEKIWKEKG